MTDYKEMYTELAEQLVGDNPLERYTHSELMEFAKDCLKLLGQYEEIEEAGGKLK